MEVHFPSRRSINHIRAGKWKAKPEIKRDDEEMESKSSRMECHRQWQKRGLWRKWQRRSSPNCFWTNPWVLQTLLICDFQGSEFCFLTVTHSIYKSWGALWPHREWKGLVDVARLLDMISQDTTMFYGEAQAVYKEFWGGRFVWTLRGERLAESLGANSELLILRNHGLLTVGQTVDEAAYLFTCRKE